MSDEDAFRRMRFFLGFVLLALVVHLALGDKPWEEGIPEREAKGKPVRPVDYWISYGYWVAAFVTVVVASLLMTQRRWFDAKAAPERLATLPPWRAPGRAWIAAVAAAALVGALLGAPRLGHSLWVDENYSVARSIHGSYQLEEAEDGTALLDFDEVKLRNTFWEYRKPNNHVFHSLLARFSIGGWEAATMPDDRRAPEPIIRLPAFVFGIASIVAVAVLGLVLGAPGAGALAAWLLALHPWHTRYLSEARGYSIAMALVSGTLIAMVFALQRGSWRRWSVYGAAQLALLWTYPGAVYHVLFMNLAALGAIVAFDRGSDALRSQLTRFFFVNLAGALFWVLMMTPNLFQLANYLGEGDGGEGGSHAWRWLVEYASHLAAGMHWSHGEGAQSFHVALDRVSPSLRWGWAALAGGALIAGIVRLATAGGLRAALLPAFLLAGPLFVAQSLVRGDLLYPWYAIFFLPPAALLVGLGVDGIATRLGGARTVPVFALAWLGALLAVGWPMHRLQAARPIYPDRDAVAHTRPLATLDAAEHAAIRTVTWSDQPSGYDPWIVRVRGPEELRRELRAADAEGQTLFVNLGRLDLSAKRRPELMAMVEDEALFEAVWTGYGSEPKGTRRIWRYRAGALRR